MKNRWSAVLSACLALCLGLSLAGCGGGGATESSHASSPEQLLIAPDPLFRDGAILQSGKQVPVWGTADASLEGETVQVSFAGQEKSAAVKNGAWRVKLDPMKACSEGQTMTFRCADAACSLHDVQVGEVFLLVGAGEAAFPAGRLQGAGKEQLKNNPDVGICRADQAPKWLRMGDRAMQEASALAVLTAQALQEQLHLPVGMLLIGQPDESGHAADYAASALLLCTEPDLPAYEEKTAALTEEYRRAQGKDLPVFQIQLPGREGERNTPEIRLQQQAMDDRLEGFCTVVTYDLGSLFDEQAEGWKMGRRLAKQLLAVCYDRGEIPVFPKAVSAEATGDGVMVLFETGGGALNIQGDRLLTLEVAGEDGAFYPAGGYVERGNRLIVTSDRVRFPYYVRYGFRSSLHPGSFFGTNGLPVMPFSLELDINI